MINVHVVKVIGPYSFRSSLRVSFLNLTIMQSDEESV